jgi:thiol-disulfide isomerase/thioredoxin
VRSTFATRIGLAVAGPRWALAIAGDRRHAGRSGSDLLLFIALVVFATELRGLVAAIWLGAEVNLQLGLRGVAHVLTRTLVLDLAFLVVGALLLFALAGPRRNLGRALDLACVAVLPLFLVHLGATFVVRLLDTPVPPAVAWVVTMLAWAWTGALLALAARTARHAGAVVPEPRSNGSLSALRLRRPGVPSKTRDTPDRTSELPPPIHARARRAGRAVLGIALAGLVVQGVWLVRHPGHVRPVDAGGDAPAFALPAIVDAEGSLGPRRELAVSRGNVVVLDFWATWCKPCVTGLPHLERLSRIPGVDVIAVNLDDPGAAFHLFATRGYRMTLLADTDGTSERYGVSTLPHTVVIDRRGVVRLVARGSAMAAVETAVQAALDDRP